VREEIMRLKARYPTDGCRAIAHLFNRQFAVEKQMRVGKTFVSDVIRQHQYDIEALRRQFKHRRPNLVPHHLIWGLDLTGKTDQYGQCHNLLGILEHRSRGCLTLKALTDKSTITILRCLLDAIERFGKPKIVRTDNEAIFTSRLFRFALSVLGIRHQRTQLACPWQNGRIERFFLTLKQKLNQWDVDGRDELNHALHLFRFWYNHVRPHQNLHGCTPAEVWQGVDPFVRHITQQDDFEAWEGLLTGIYLRY